MSITSCPLPDPRVQQLIKNLGEYQTGRVVESFSMAGKMIPDVNSKEMTDLVNFWKSRYGHPNETPAEAKKRILSLYGKKGTHSMIEPHYYPKARLAINDYNRMKGKKLLNEYEHTKGLHVIYQVKEASNAMPLAFQEGFADSTQSPIMLDLDPVKGSKFVVLIRAYVNKRKDLGKRLSQLRQERASTKDTVEKTKLSEKIEAVETEIDEITDQIASLEEERAVEAIYPLALKDIEKISEIANEESINNPDSITFDQLNFADKLVRAWLAVSDVTSPNHPFLSDMELENPAIIENLNNINYQMREFSKVIENLGLKKVLKETGTYLGKNIKATDLMKPIKDTNLVASKTLALQRMNPMLLQAIANKIKDVEFMSVQEYKEIEKDFDVLLNKAIPELLQIDKNNPFSIFKQIDGEGYETGRLVYRISQQYYDTVQKLLRFAKVSSDPSERMEAWQTFFTWMKDNSFYIDPTRIEEKAYIEEIKKHYGERGLEKLLERVKRKHEEFKQDRESMKILYETEGYEDSELLEQLDLWEKKNDPKYFLEDLEAKTLRKIGDRVIYPTAKYIEHVPRRFTDSGKETGHYDSKYDRISKSDNLYNLHEKMIELISTFRKVLPPSITGDDLKINSIPSLSRSTMELFAQEGFSETGRALLDQFINSNTTVNTSGITYQSVDPLTGAIEPSLNFKLHFTTEADIMSKVNERMLIDKANGIKVTPEMKKRYYKEEMDKLSKEMSWDLGKVMKVYAFHVIEYKHKAMVEDLLMWQKRIFEKTPQQEQRFGKTRTLADTGEVVLEQGDALTYYKSILNHTMNYFLGMPIRDVEGVSEKKVYDSEDSKKKKQYESALRTAQMSYESGEMTQKDYEVLRDELRQKIDNLGGKLTFSKIGDNILQYYQLKGMGWNVFAGLTNVGFGMISNMLMASDGREYNEKNFWQAFRISLASIANNFSFDQTKGVETPFFKDAMKLRSLMDRNNILKEASQEMFKRSIENKSVTALSSFSKRMKFLNPYSPQMRSEYLVQSMMLAAMMKSDKNKVTDLSGRERPLWDAFDVNGNWNYDEFGVKPEWEYNGEKMLNFLRRVDSVIAEAHGDYTNPLQIKKEFLGRALSQFRTWMFEGFANRFEGEYYDENRSYIRKGRYRSFDSGGLAVAGAIAGTGLFPGIGTVIGGVGGYFAGVGFLKSNNDSHPLKMALFHTKQLLKRMLIVQRVGNFDLSLSYDEKHGFTEVDAANMRKNMTEIAIYIYLYSFGMMLKAMLDDEDDKTKWIMNFLINQGNRLETDILFYTNPMELDKLIRQLIPALSLVNDADKWFDAVGRQFDGRPDMLTGPFKGENILLRRSLENIPFGTQYYKVRKNALYLMEL